MVRLQRVFSRSCCLIAIAALGTSIAWSQDSRIKPLLESTKNENECSVSCEQLAELRDSSPQTRKDIVLELEKELQDMSNVPVWRSEVRVAGQLQLSELAPVVAKSLDHDTRGGFHDMPGMSQKLSLDYDAAVKTLVTFDTQAVPALSEELAKGNNIGRYRAALALSHIKSPEAEAALRTHYTLDSDIHVKAFIKRTLELRGISVD